MDGILAEARLVRRAARKPVRESIPALIHGASVGRVDQ
jgi:hypothetical protein